MAQISEPTSLVHIWMSCFPIQVQTQTWTIYNFCTHRVLVWVAIPTESLKEMRRGFHHNTAHNCKSHVRHLCSSNHQKLFPAAFFQGASQLQTVWCFLCVPVLLRNRNTKTCYCMLYCPLCCHIHSLSISACISEDSLGIFLNNACPSCKVFWSS